MRGISLRVGTNVLTFILFGVGIVTLALATFASGLFLDDTYDVSVVIPDAGGVLPRQEVTVMGRAVGTVSDAELVDGGVELHFDVQPQFTVPDTAQVRIIRRSPIGEQAVELTPVPADGWTAAGHGTEITVDEAVEPTTVQDLLDTTVSLFDQVSPENTATIIRELAVALDGRTDIIKELNDSSLDLGQTILEGQDEFRRLLDTSEPLLTTLDDHADDLVDLFDSGGDLAEVLAENRPNVEELLRVAPTLLGEATQLVVDVRPDVQCLVDDLITVNDMLLGPSTATGAPARLYDSKLDEVQRAIDDHRFFFQLGLPLVIQPDPDTGMGWARVKFELDKLGSGDRYDEPRPTPATTPGAACQTAAWGTGVNAVRQPDHQPADPTSPGILWAPLVEPVAGPGAVGQPGGSPSRGGDDRAPLPATGGGLALLAVSATLGSLIVSRRR